MNIMIDGESLGLKRLDCLTQITICFSYSHVCVTMVQYISYLPKARPYATLISTEDCFGNNQTPLTGSKDCTKSQASHQSKSTRVEQ